jgi:hypothetical protein
MFSMATDRDNFTDWYVTVLESLYPQQNAGFVVVTVAFVLLERYLRQKAGLAPQARLSNDFYQELSRVVPELRTQAEAKQFWQVHRNGLLHEATLSSQTRNGMAMPAAYLTHTRRRIVVETDGSFWLNPVDFAKTVVAAIEADFATFEGSGKAAQLPVVMQVSLPTGSLAQTSAYLGTGSRP